ncbi:MAG: ATP-binding protein [Pseudomonadota bacterium]
MRFNIASKIAVSIIGMVILSVGTMAWISSQNLKAGFISYLNEQEADNLQELSKLFAAEYIRDGSFERFHDNRRAMRELLDKIRPQAARADADTAAPPVRRPRADLPPLRAEDGRPRRRAEAVAEANGEAAPRRADTQAAPPPPGDPTGFGQRLSLIAQDGRALIGPQDAPGGKIVAIVVDNVTVGSLRLAPQRHINNPSGSGFVRSQIRQMLWLAAGLTLFAMLFSVWLARHLLRPVTSLQSVTRRIAQGQFDARANVISQDELGELALQVNAMAQSLQHSETQRRKILANISHELRTPLTVIRGEIEAMLDGIRHLDPSALKSLHEEVLRLNKLIDDIHQINLADSGDLSYQLTRIDLVAFMQESLERFRPNVEKAKLRLISQLPSSPLYINADTGRLNQVISNLLENSIRYTDAGGCIQCSISRSGPVVELCIEDSAPGAPEGTHARLFERLYRVDHARSREHGGSGLGLSICKALIETHNGKIEALPSALGGVKILIRLPAIT